MILLQKGTPKKISISVSDTLDSENGIYNLKLINTTSNEEFESTIERENAYFRFDLFEVMFDLPSGIYDMEISSDGEVGYRGKAMIVFESEDPATYLNTETKSRTVYEG